MRLTRAALMLGAALLPLTAAARTLTAEPAAATAQAGADAVKPLNFTERTLANGMQVYAIRDTSTSNVSVQVWYKVGSVNDPKGRSGFAHMFEHLMFKGTRNLAPEQMDRLTEDVGGFNNASTNDDYTNYYEVVPANHLQRLLFAEADRMSGLVVDQKNFDSERHVVEEELRSRVLAQPYGKLFYLYFPEMSFRTSPYGRPGIGSIEDLDSATLTDLRAFHATYYRPDNAILVVSGNFDPAQLNKWVDKYFGDLKNPDRPIPGVNLQEPERTKPVDYTVYEPNTPLPAVAISYPLPPDNSPDMPALEVLDAILSGGHHSRLYDNVVYKDQLAAQANTYLDTKRGPGALAVYAIMAGGKTADQGVAALRQQIAALRDAPVTPEELSEAKNEIVTNALHGRETAQGKASTLAQSVIIDGDPHAADKQLAEIQKVTAADVQRVARKYLAEDRSATLRYLPESAKPADAKSDTLGVSDTIAVKPLTPPANIPVVTAATGADRIPLPKPGAPVKANIPTPHVSTLPNGVKLVVVERHDLPLVSALVSVNGGSVLDPKGKAGLASITDELLTKGTATRSATEIAEQIESLGGSIGSGSSWDSGTASVDVRSNEIEPAMRILADVAQNPAFAQGEIDRERKQTIDGINVQLKNPAALAAMAANRAVFGDAPYGHLDSGTPKSLGAIGRDDIAAAYDATWRPDRATIVMVGDVTQAQAQQLATRYFGSWKAPAGAAAAPVPATTSYPAPRVIVVDMPDAGQAGVVVARPGIARNNPEYYAGQVANSVLGGGYSSRLNEEVRVKRGLAYGAGSSLDARRRGGVVSARTQTKNPSAAEVVSIMVDQMKKMGTEPVKSDELEPRKATLIGGFGRAAETNSSVASILASYVSEDVPVSEIDKFIPEVQGVNAAQVQSAAARLLDPSKASIVVVGDAKQFVGDLRKTYPDLEVIEAKDLDLDSATLK
ncbi:M16 family metallopeptidase [Stakelama marina]|uniref:Insulinase family protein n=1 Tax=Stakelama marina TaxID=2826939 RepID=A0A8T4IJ87_9SPHN|nr:pitrilysin family protein [Stakelama marina]MBR0552389.1 insulinase family protein [Stakelama marina]